MNAARLKELLATYAVEHPDRPLSQVTVVEFAEWLQTSESWARIEAAAKAWDDEARRK